MIDYAELVKLLKITPLYEGSGEESNLPETAGGAIEALVRENEELRLIITGGEDAPGYASSIPPDDLRDMMARERREMNNWIDRFATASEAARAARDLTAKSERERDELLAALQFQSRVRDWILACFGSAISDHKTERNHRFLEEALELVQAYGCTADEARQLVDYVYGRPVGEPTQEVGGVMVTLAALCGAHGVNMMQCAEDELARINAPGVIEKIRAKQAAKPKYGPLPGFAALTNNGGRDE